MILPDYDKNFQVALLRELASNQDLREWFFQSYEIHIAGVPTPAEQKAMTVGETRTVTLTRLV